MNTPVSFKLAKLLQEKGFDEPCPNLYYAPERCKKPTIAEVVMWLYEKHGIWIANNWQSSRKTFLYELIDINSQENTILIQENNYKDVGEVEYTSPTEAYEAAIEYILNNLI